MKNLELKDLNCIKKPPAYQTLEYSDMRFFNT